ncbi:PEGA domain-containing protein [Myxococcota bacterium]|nr:PEGA domain-containing protein [Myxococcota bacterium]
MGRYRKSFGWGVFLSCWWVASLAYAQEDDESKKIGVFPVQATVTNLPKREVRRFSLRLSQKLAAAGAQLIRKYPLLGGTPPRAAAAVDLNALKQQDLTPIRQALSTGEAKLQEQAFDDAIKPLRDALQFSASKMRWAESYDLFTASLASLALAYLQIGRNDNGETLLKNLARLDPNPLPKMIQGSRPMRFRYKRAQGEIRSINKVSLKLTGTAGAEVFVNGVSRGKLPLEVADLYEGFNYVRVEAAGYIPEGMAVKLQAGMAAQQFDLKKAAAAAAPDPLQATKDLLTVQVQKEAWDTPAFSGAASKLCEEAGLDALVTGQISPMDESRHRFTPVRYDCKTRKLQVLAALPMQNELQDADEALAKIAPTLVKSPEAPKPRAVDREPPPQRRDGRVAVITRPPVPNPSTDRPVHQQWWFWTIIGAAVVGGGATAAYFLLQPPKMNFRATWDPNFGAGR